MKRKGRTLWPEEQKLWEKVTETATPLDKKPLSISTPPKKDASKTQEPLLPKSFRVGERATVAPKSTTRIPVKDQPVRMDRKAFLRMKRGKSNLDARIDLHGMTVDVAHSALLAFLLRAHADGKRLVLVITGKGKPNTHDDVLGSPRGILRRQVPHWLEQPPLRQIVLQTVPAHQKHGGDGALYVYLRR